MDTPYEMKDVAGFPDYQITKDGKIWSKKSKKFLKPRPDKDGYLRVDIYRNHKQYTRFIHRLVGLTYIELVPNKPYIDHIDRNRQNNCVENLRWVTHAENM